VRALADEARVRALMRALGKAAREPTSIYLTGGATAVLQGWRGTTIDVDLRLEPDSGLLTTLSALKERLDINVELASPLDFIPVARDWRARSPFIERIGQASFHHFDLHAQALAKVERGHAQDAADVLAMLERGYVTPGSLWQYYDAVVQDLVRYPAIDQKALEGSLASKVGPRPP
jgi:hypothetical protein